MGFSSPVKVNLKTLNLSKVYDYVSQVVDYEDLEQLGSAINAARLALFQLNDKLNEAERLHKEAEIAYEREWRRQYLNCHEKTEKAKTCYCDIMCENLENDVIATDHVVKQLTRATSILRAELQTLQAVGNNIRQQLKME